MDGGEPAGPGRRAGAKLQGYFFLSFFFLLSEWTEGVGREAFGGGAFICIIVIFHHCLV